MIWEEVLHMLKADAYLKAVKGVTPESNKIGLNISSQVNSS